MNAGPDYRPGLRDRIGVRLLNVASILLCSRAYRLRLKGFIVAGMRCFADYHDREAAPPPRRHRLRVVEGEGFYAPVTPARGTASMPRPSDGCSRDAHCRGCGGR